MRAAARSVASKAARSFARGAPACSSGATRTAATAAAISASSAAGAWSKASAGVAATLGAGLILATPLLQPTECSATPMHGKPGTAGERTFLMVKPEGVARGLVSEIIGRWEKRGYTLVGIKVLQPDAKLAGEHYADLSARPFFKDLVHYMSSSGPVVAMVWQGKDVIKVSRDMIGMTNPLTSAPGTVRGDLAVNIGRNVIHGSDGVEGAETEIPLWFQSHELVNIDSTKWPQHVGLYLYDTKQA